MCVPTQRQQFFYVDMCSEFVTPQKNVLLATQTNLNDKKSRQVH